MSNTQFVAVKFRPEDARTYTYQWDGDPLSPGDEVKVPHNRSDGWKRVTVESVTDDAPSFACKSIIGRAEARDDDATLDADDLISPEDLF